MVLSASYIHSNRGVAISLHPEAKILHSQLFTEPHIFHKPQKTSNTEPQRFLFHMENKCIRPKSLTPMKKRLCLLSSTSSLFSFSQSFIWARFKISLTAAVTSLVSLLWPPHLFLLLANLLGWTCSYSWAASAARNLSRLTGMVLSTVTYP